MNIFKAYKTNLYYDVQDFHWLKQQNSPNWSINEEKKVFISPQ